MLEYINTRRKLHHSFVSIPIYIFKYHTRKMNIPILITNLIKYSKTLLPTCTNWKTLIRIFFLPKWYIYTTQAWKEKSTIFHDETFENIGRRGSKRNRARKRVEPRNGGAAAAAAAAGAGATPVRGPGPGLCAPRSVEFHGVYSFQTTNPRAVGCPVAALLAA